MEPLPDLDTPDSDDSKMEMKFDQSTQATRSYVLNLRGGAASSSPFHLKNEAEMFCPPVQRCPRYKRTLGDFFGTTIYEMLRLQTRLKRIKAKFRNSCLQELVCLSCYRGVFENQPVFIIEDCNHLYHERCVRDWFTNEQNCPTCSINPEDRY